jgi:hypothetical protein
MILPTGFISFGLYYAMVKRSLFQLLFISILFLGLTGCRQKKKFDREKWAYGDGLSFPQRDDVIDDLLKYHRLKGLTYHQVIDSLGAAQGKDSLQLTYEIVDTRYTRHSGAAQVKNLILHFSKDSVVVKADIYDHTYKEEKKKK